MRSPKPGQQPLDGASPATNSGMSAAPAKTPSRTPERGCAHVNLGIGPTSSKRVKYGIRATDAFSDAGTLHIVYIKALFILHRYNRNRPHSTIDYKVPAQAMDEFFERTKPVQNTPERQEGEMKMAA